MRCIPIFLVVLFLLGCGGNQREFTPEEWLKTDEYGRHVFVGDLIASERLIGRDSGEVEQMLGTPTYRSKQYWTYVVDKGGPFAGVKILHIEFDDDVVVDAYRRTD